MAGPVKKEAGFEKVKKKFQEVKLVIP